MNGRADSLTKEQVGSLVSYGDLIDVKVTETTLNGKPAVAYRDTVCTDYYRAFRQLQAMANEICAGQGQAA